MEFGWTAHACRCRRCSAKPQCNPRLLGLPGAYHRRRHLTICMHSSQLPLESCHPSTASTSGLASRECFNGWPRLSVCTDKGLDMKTPTCACIYCSQQPAGVCTQTALHQKPQPHCHAAWQTLHVSHKVCKCSEHGKTQQMWQM